MIKNQTFKEFFTSKTSLAGLGVIAAAVVGMYFKEISFMEGTVQVFGGLGLIGGRDAIAGMIRQAAQK